MPSYGSLVGHGLTFAGVDQGIDFTGKGAVFALGDGVVTRVIKRGSGWPGEGALLVYRITSGPAKGRFVYIAEDFAIAQGLKLGSRVKQGQALGMATGSGRAPGIEIGWAQANGLPVAALGKNKRAATAAGQHFLKFVTSGKAVDESAAPSAPVSAPASTGPAEGAAAPLPSYQPQPLTPVAQAPQALDPGTVQAGGFDAKQFREYWQLISQQPQASQDTQDYARLFSGAG